MSKLFNSIIRLIIVLVIGMCSQQFDLLALEVQDKQALAGIHLRAKQRASDAIEQTAQQLKTHNINTGRRGVLEKRLAAYGKILTVIDAAKSALGIERRNKKARYPKRKPVSSLAAIRYTQILADAKFLPPKDLASFEHIKRLYTPKGIIQKLSSSYQRGRLLTDLMPLLKKTVWGMFTVGVAATPVAQGIHNQPRYHVAKRALAITPPSPSYQTMEDTPICFGGNNTVSVSGIPANETGSLLLTVSPFQNGNLTINSTLPMPGVTNTAVDRVQVSGNSTHIESVMKSGKVCFEPAPEFSGKANIRAIAYVGQTQDLKNFEITVTEVHDPIKVTSFGFSVNDPKQVIKYQPGLQIVAVDPDTPQSAWTVSYTNLKHIRVYRTTNPTTSITSHEYDATNVEYELDGSGKQPEMTGTVGDGSSTSTRTARIKADFPEKSSLVGPLAGGGGGLVAVGVGTAVGVHLYKRNKVFRDHSWEAHVHKKLGLKCSIFSKKYLSMMQRLKGALNAGDNTWFERKCAAKDDLKLLVMNTVLAFKSFKPRTEVLGGGINQEINLVKNGAINYGLLGFENDKEDDNSHIGDLAGDIRLYFGVDKGKKIRSTLGEKQTESEQNYDDSCGYGNYDNGNSGGYEGLIQGAGPDPQRTTGNENDVVLQMTEMNGDDDFY